MILLGDIHVDVVVRHNERAAVGLEESTEERIWRGEGMWPGVSACDWREVGASSTGVDRSIQLCLDGLVPGDQEHQL